MADIVALTEVLRARRSDLGIDDNEWEQLSVFLEAFALFMDREAKYHSLWKEYGAADSFQHMRSKLARTQFLLEAFSTDQDDPLDLINYTAFFLRNLRDKRILNKTDVEQSPIQILKSWGYELVVDPETPEVRLMDKDECIGSIFLG